MGKQRKNREQKKKAAALAPAAARRPEPVVLPPAPRGAVILWTIAGFLCAWSFGYTPMMGADLWWHVASGRYIVDTGHIFNLTDPWSFTFHDKPWLHHEWLSDVVFDTWRRLLGLDSLVYWKWGVIIATFVILMNVMRRVTSSPAAAFIASVVAAACGSAFMDVRPQLYSLCGFSIVLALTLPRERPSWFLPGIFLIWANLHGGFFFGLMALGLASLPHWFRAGAAGFKRAAIIFVLCALASVLTPNGFEAFLYPIKYAFDQTSPFRGLGEWHPPFEPGGIRSEWYPYVIALTALSAVVVLAVPRLRRDYRISITGIGLAALTLAMSLRSRRFVSLFGISSALLVAPALSELFRVGRAFTAKLPFPRAMPYLGPVLAIGLGVYWLWPYPQSSYAFHYLTSEGSFPVEVVNYVQANHIKGKVFGFYNWGGYFHLRTNGDLQVFIDGRADTIYDAQTYNEYLAVLAGYKGWQNVVEKSGAEYILWPKGRGPMLNEMPKTGNWRLLYEDDVAQLLIRKDVPPPSPVVETPPSAWKELAVAGDLMRRRDMSAAEEHLYKSLDMMPWNASSCRLLLRVQMVRGEKDAARRTNERCDRVFPRAEQKDWAENQIAQMKSS